MIEYVVTLHRKEDLDDFYNDMETPGGSITIPNRAVSTSNRRAISRNTHYMLTPEEAELVRNDSRVAAVMPASLERSVIRPLTTQTANFNKSDSNINSHVNWGLYRCINGEQVTDWGSDNTPSLNASITLGATGKNVDVVIIDGHIDPTHPEFAKNSDGTGGSRVVQLNWHIYSTAAGNLDDDGASLLTGDYVYTPYDFFDGGTLKLDGDNNHGAHVAGTACGNTQGWARDANIYNISPYSTSSNNLDSLAMWDYIRAFHANKAVNPVTGKKNPTVCNGSYGSGFEFNFGDFGPVTRVEYRGVDTGVVAGGLTTQQLIDNGIYDDGNQIPYVPYYSAATAADIEDAIAEGIHVVGASGNESFYVDSVTGADYNNILYATYLGVNYIWYYHRGSAPASVPGAICVGNTGSLVAETKADSSNCGPRIDIYAPGTNIMSSFNSNYSFGGTTDSRDSNYYIGKIGGTSMASPQVCGVLACVLETYPEMTPAQAMDYLITYSKKDQMGDTGGSYGDLTSLNGAPNRYLYFNKERKDTGVTVPKINYLQRPASGAVYPRPRKKLIMPQSKIVTDGLQLFLDAGDLRSYPGSGTVWSDLSGNGYNGTLTGSAVFDNTVDSTIAFNGTSDYVSFTTYPDFNGTSFTVGCWFKTTDGDMRLIGNRLNGGTGTIAGWKISARNGHWGNTGVDNGSGNEISFSDISNSPYIDGNWHFVVLVFDTITGSCSLNIDGVNLSTKTKSTLIGGNFTSTDLVLGRSNSGDQYLNGNISLAFVYNKALSESEIQQNFNALRGRYGI